VTILMGCTGFPTEGEMQAEGDLATVGGHFQQGMALPVPRADSGLDDFLRHAILNQPQVVAAYYDWAASVRKITVERSLPDPSLTLSADITRTVESLMPGLMMDLPGPGKLQAAAGVATAESQAKYYVFEGKVLEVAFVLKKAYYELHFLDGKIRVNQETLRLANDTETLAQTQNEAGKVTLQDVLRAQMEQDRLVSEIENLEDTRVPMIAQFKAALGLKRSDPAPPVPLRFQSTPLNLASEDLISSALARNPRLRAMEAEVQGADAALRLAYRAGVPDFSLGIEADVKSTPTMMTPTLSVTLPIWRDKIAAQIAAAQEAKAASEARVSAEEIGLAVEFSEKSFTVREAGRSLTLLQDRLLPKARQSLEVAQISYASGKVDFLNLLEAQRTLRELQLAEVEARLQRELALAELSLVVLGKPPAGSPVLSSTGIPKEEKP
jgi:cobalt-zinc-cadmium efflux system outer membrane protein